MKSFLIVIVGIFFIACSSDPANNLNGDTKKTETNKNTTPVVSSDEDTEPADSDTVSVSVEEKIDDLSTEENTRSKGTVTASVAKTTNSELVSLEEVSTDVPSDVTEDLVPLDLTEDQSLVNKITKRYNDYVALKKDWENLFSNLETSMDQVINQDFLYRIHSIQALEEVHHPRLYQITEIEEVLKEQEGTFIYDEYRKNVEKKYEELNVFVNFFEESLDIIFQYVERAEECPGILYVATTGDEKECPNVSHAEETSDIVPIDDLEVTEEISTTEDDTAVADSAEETTSDKEDETETIEDPSSETVVTNTVAMTEDESTKTAPESTILSSEKPVQSTPDIITTQEDTDNEETPDIVTITPQDDEIVAPADEGVIDDDTDKEIEKSPADKTSDDLEVTEEISTTEDDTAVADSAEETSINDVVDTQSKEEISFMEDVVTSWNKAVTWFDETFTISRLGEWFVEPIVTAKYRQHRSEEEEVSSSSEGEAYRLISGFIQNVKQFAETHKVQDAEDFARHLQRIFIMPETERTAEQSVLLGRAKQVVQGIDQMAEGSVADFVEFSGYTSNDDLSQAEVVEIVEMVFEVLDSIEAQQEEVGADNSQS